MHNFITHSELSEVEKKKLANAYYLRVKENKNLYIVTHELEKSKEIGEIEDLFDQNTLSHQIDGNTFSRDDKCDKNNYYSKDRFSKYVYQNYEKISYNQFESMLDAIKNCIKR